MARAGRLAMAGHRWLRGQVVSSVENWIPECHDGHYRERDLGKINTIIIHRIDVGKNAAQIADFLKEYPGVGGMAYTFVVTPNGTIQQAQPLSDVTPHARRFNTRGVGVGCIGDFRKHPPTHDQWRAAMLLCVKLKIHLPTTTVYINGHDELLNASKDKDKKCPGKHWNMNKFRRDADDLYAMEQAKRIRESGIVI